MKNEPDDRKSWINDQFFLRELSVEPKTGLSVVKLIALVFVVFVWYDGVKNNNLKIRKIFFDLRLGKCYNPDDPRRHHKCR